MATNIKMSMKKKFLALALAGMVAMPVVANASGQTNTIDIGKNEVGGASVTLTGSVDSDSGQAPAGRIQVELPSAVTFSVDKDGIFTAPTNFEINNTGQEAIKVEVTEFIQSKPDTGSDKGIVVVEKGSSTLASANRTNMSLVLVGADGEADLSQVKPSSPVKVFSNITGGTKQTLTLRGQVGQTTGGVAQGVSEDFTVKFRISHA